VMTRLSDGAGRLSVDRVDAPNRAAADYASGTAGVDAGRSACRSRQVGGNSLRTAMDPTLLE
jgi:hypothetical protein